MNFQELDQSLTGRNKQSRKLANNTYAARDGDDIVIRLHSTNIVTYKPDGRVVLDTGGWKTKTTRDRINQYSPVKIHQCKSIWYVGVGHTSTHLYEDLMWVDQGLNIHAKPIEDANDIVKAKTKLRASAKRYAKDYVDALLEGKIEEPSGGDCWSCYMKAGDGTRPLADASHILSHIEDKYYVPSLVVNAITEFPASMMGKSVVGYCLTGRHEEVSGIAEAVKDQLITAVFKVCMKDLEKA